MSGNLPRTLVEAQMGAQLRFVITSDAGLCEGSERAAHRVEAIEDLGKRLRRRLIADRRETESDTLQVGTIFG